MITIHTQQLKNFFLLSLCFLAFALPLNCHASDPDTRGDSHYPRVQSTNGEEGLIIEESNGDSAEKPSEPLTAGNDSQYKDKLSDRPSPSILHKSIEAASFQEQESEPIEDANLSLLNRASQSPKRRGHEITAQKPSQLFMFLGKNYIGINDGRRCFPEDAQVFESAMVFYNPKQVSSSEAYNWDSITTFISEMDKRFFTQKTTKCFTIQSVVRRIVSLGMGFVAATPATGTLVRSIGDFFNIPIGEGLSTGLVTWTMLTTTPCFSANLNKRFYIILDTLFGQEVYPTRSDKNASKPCIIKTSTSHKAAIAVLLLGSGIDAIVNLGIVSLAYLENFPNVFYGTGWAYFLSWMERYYTTGRAKIDRLFCKYQYDTELSHRKRLLLLESLKKGQQAIANNDSFVNALYSKILNNSENVPSLSDEEEGNNQKVFALSALFLQTSNTIPLPEESNDLSEEPSEESSLLASGSHNRANSPEKELKRLKQENERLEKSNITLTNFQIQQDTSLSGKEDLLDQLSTILTGAASVGRAVTMEYVVEQLLVNVLSASAPTATGLAWAVSIFDLLYRTFTEGDTQKEYMRGWLNSFSLKHLGDFQWIRKISGWASIINGGLFSLAKTVAGIYAFQSWNAPIMFEIITLVPAFIQDQAYYGAFFKAGNDELTTGAGTIRKPRLNAHINVRRAWLMKWSRKIEELLSTQWDRDTIGNLYTIILKGF